MINVIIFGLWETLGSKHFSVSKALREHFGIQDTSNYLQKYEQSLQLEIWDNIGKMAKSFLEAFNLQLSKKNVNNVISIIQKGIDQAELFDGIEPLLKKLQPKYKLAILSNTNNFETTVIEKWGIDKYFSKEFYSFNLKSLKPSRNNFHEVCKHFGVEPYYCLYVDNEERSIKAAKEYGFKIIAFNNVPELERQLNFMEII